MVLLLNKQILEDIRYASLERMRSNSFRKVLSDLLENYRFYRGIYDIIDFEKSSDEDIVKLFCRSKDEIEIKRFTSYDGYDELGPQSYIYDLVVKIKGDKEKNINTVAYWYNDQYWFEKNYKGKYHLVDKIVLTSDVLVKLTGNMFDVYKFICEGEI